MISITFRQVCLLINRGSAGAEVVFPNTGHELVVGSGLTPVTGLVEVIRQNPANSATSEIQRADLHWIPRLSDVAGVPVTPRSREEILRDPRCRAVVALSGGKFVTGRAYPPPAGFTDYGDSQWTHGLWRGQLTNWVRWEGEPGSTYALTQNGNTLHALNDGNDLVLTNVDSTPEVPADTGSSTVAAEDFDLLYAFVTGAPGPVKPETGKREPPEHQAPPAPGLWFFNPKLPLCPVGQG